MTCIIQEHGQPAPTNPYTYENLYTNYFSRGRQLPPYARVSVVSYILLVAEGKGRIKKSPKWT